MAADINIKLDSDFAKQLSGLADFFRAWDKSTVANLQKALRIIGVRWQAEAVKRVPVDSGNLKQRILYEVIREAGEWLVAVGTNVPYGKYLEFGTKFIAGGRVKALGMDVGITDSQAIKDWPAKTGGLITSQIGLARMRASKGFLNGNPSEQMPWLRTSMNVILGWAVEQLTQAAQPPNSKVA